MQEGVQCVGHQGRRSGLEKKGQEPTVDLPGAVLTRFLSGVKGDRG